MLSLPLQCLIAAAKEDAERRETLVLVNTRLLALVTNFDSVAAEPEKLEAAAELYRDLLGSVGGLAVGGEAALGQGPGAGHAWGGGVQAGPRHVEQHHHELMLWDQAPHIRGHHAKLGVLA